MQTNTLYFNIERLEAHRMDDLMKPAVCFIHIHAKDGIFVNTPDHQRVSVPTQEQAVDLCVAFHRDYSRYLDMVKELTDGT